MSMTQIIALREKRAQKWDAAKAFLNAKTGADGTMAAEDAAAYDRMEAEVVNLGDEIARLERQQNLDEQLNQPTSDVLHGAKPGQTEEEQKRPRATDAYRSAFWTNLRNKSIKHEVYDALQVGQDSEGGYLAPDEYQYCWTRTARFMCLSRQSPRERKRRLKRPLRRSMKPTSRPRFLGM